MNTEATNTLTLTVSGMTCGHCKAAVTESVSAVPGVATVDVDLDTKLVSVHGTNLDRAAIVEAIDAAGFDATE